jgi:uncharacterized protein (TIGR02391 family)
MPTSPQGMTEYVALLANLEVLRSLEPEELAGYLIAYLNGVYGSQGRTVHRYNETSLYQLPPDACSPEDLRQIQAHQEEISKLLMEAWMWLEHEGFLAPLYGEHGLYFITRRGARMDTPTSLEAFRKADLLPQRLIHPRIAPRVWSAFRRGDYDTAVFQAFKEVEGAVRAVGGFGPEDYGAELMRKAFRVQDGPLTDKNVPVAEQEALAHLFAGAVASYNNPHSHRHVALEVEETVEMIMLASHLLRIVDSRS